LGLFFLNLQSAIISVMKAASRAKNSRHWRRWLLIVLASLTIAIAVFVGVVISVGSSMLDGLRNAKPPAAINEQPPCDTKATYISLADAFANVDKPAYLTTDGGDVYVSVRYHGGLFDPAKGYANVWIGDATNLPTYNQQTNQVTNAKLRLAVEDQNYRKAQLPAGRYWLWASGRDVVAASCGSISGLQPDGSPASTISPSQ
jgi:hypothetical protein